MSTSKTYQQSLADAGSENRPPMLERGAMMGNFWILLSIPNDIYNSVDACTSAKDMWKRVKRLMRGTIQNKVDRETRFTNKFDQFVAEPGEALVSVYNHFAQLMNDLERNDMHFPIVTINTKFLNSLQPEWLKYVTQVRLAKRLTVDSRKIVKGIEYSNDGPKMFKGLFEPRLQEILQLFNATTVVEKDIMLGIVQSQDTIGDDQIDSNIILDSSNGNDNSGSIEKDTHVPDLCALERLARNAYQEAEKQQIFAQKVQKQNTTLTSQLELYKERVRVLENINGDNNYLNEFLEADKRAKHFSQQAQSQFVRDRDIIRDLEKQRDKLDLDVKDYKRKNEELQKTRNSEISLNIRDTEDTLDDASKSQQKVYEKMSDPIAVANKSGIKKTYAYGAIRAENQNILFTISELKTRLANVEKEENHVVSKPVTLQTSPAKQRGVNSNKNVIAPRMYKVVTTHESQTNEAKHDLSSTRMNIASSVRRPMNRDSLVKNSVLANSKKPAKKVAVYVRKNKQTDNTSENVISNKENVIDVDVANASKAKTLLCVSCMQNVLIPCHDNCFANYKLNVHSNVRRTLSTKSRTPKSYDTTYVVRKTRFSKESALSKSLDTKINVGSTSKANDKVVQIVLWIVDSGCSKHMTSDRSLLKNFIEKFMGTVRFGNDNFAAITGYGDYIQGNITICHVYDVEGLGHNLFSVGQFCDGDLEVAFRFKTCYVRNLEGDDFLTGGRESNLYTISIFDMAASSPVCLMSKATSTKSWLWHHRLSHLNFGTINDLTRLELVDGLPKFKYGKDHLCSACERGKSKKASHPLKLVPSDHSKLELLYMDLYSPMRVASINGKKYILVIVDDYSRYTWVYFLHLKDETPEIIKKFIAQAQLNYQAKVCKIRIDNGTEFKMKLLKLIMKS
ncbi:integrase, catalytic region, zinc finger, CCHC-type containing protein [Tanacetum coccineum]